MNNYKLLGITVLIGIALLGAIGGVHAKTFYVRPTGQDSASGTTPKTAWATLKKACQSVPANQGHVIQIAPGVYHESGTVTIPSGVTLCGAGVTKTTIMGTRSPIFAIKNGKAITISGMRFDGASLGDSLKKMTFLLQCRGITDFEMENVRFENFNYTAEIHQSKNIKIHDFSGKNASVGTQAALSFVTAAENVEIYNGDLFNDDAHGGKAVDTGPDPTANPTRPWELPLAQIKDFRIHDLRHLTAAVGRWEVPGTNTYPPQICVEFWHSQTDNVEVYNCEFNNTVSCQEGLSHKRQPDEKTIRLHHNRWTKCRGYAIETGTNNMEIDHNFVDGGGYPIAEFGRDPAENLSIHHNVFQGQGFPTPGIHLMPGARNLSFINNTMYLTENRNIFYFGDANTPRENIQIKNNIFYSTIGKIDTVEIFGDFANNLFYDVMPGGNGAIVGDPKFVLDSSMPATLYTLKSDSPAIAAGIVIPGITVALPGKAPDLGAFATGMKPWVSGPQSPWFLSENKQ